MTKNELNNINELRTVLYPVLTKLRKVYLKSNELWSKDMHGPFAHALFYTWDELDLVLRGLERVVENNYANKK